MTPLRFLPTGRPPRVLAIGAHCDDIEIGAGGTLATLAEARPDSHIHSLVLASTPAREAESRACLADLCKPAAVVEVTACGLRDSRLPAQFDEVKDVLDEWSREPWDVVLTHHSRDAHQDHRMLGQLVPTAFRNHLVLQFEIPKWDGDLGSLEPNLYVPLTPVVVDQKWSALDTHHVSQRDNDWWQAETFSALARLRGMECRSPYAEAFRINKGVLVMEAG